MLNTSTDRESKGEITLSRFREPVVVYQVPPLLLIRLCFRRKLYIYSNMNPYSCTHTHTSWLPILGEETMEEHKRWVLYCETILNLSYTCKSTVVDTVYFGSGLNTHTVLSNNFYKGIFSKCSCTLYHCNSRTLHHTLRIPLIWKSK